MGHKIAIEPAGDIIEAAASESILDAALRAGLALPYGCRNGTCGTCRGTLLEGRVHYPLGLAPPALTKDAEAEHGVLPCCAIPDSDLRVEIISTAEDATPVRIMPARVEQLRALSPDVVCLRLKLPDSVRMPFRAGQYVNVLLRDGRRRAFSIANAPHDDEWLELHIRYIPGGEFTAHVFADLREKEILRIEGPLGAFYLREDSPRPALLVAGGTGFAPLKGILEHAFHVGDRRQFHLYWGARARADLYLLELAERWAGEHSNLRFTPVLAEPRAEDRWEGRRGLVTDVVVADYPELSSFDVYASGPPAMVEAGARLFLSRGLPRQQIFSDAFTFAHDGKAVARRPR